MSATNPGSDLYRGLGVAPDASTEQIARAYRRLARRYHPDISATTDAAEDFARITHAYRVLSDPPARARYDATRTARTRTTDTGEGRAAPTGRRSPWTRAWPSAAAATREALWLGGPNFSRAFHVGARAQAAVSTEPGCELEVHADLLLSPWEAALGTTITHDGPVGPVSIQVPAGSSSGVLLRVLGQGLPNPNPTGPAGDLCLRVSIVVPARPARKSQ